MEEGTTSVNETGMPHGHQVHHQHTAVHEKPHKPEYRLYFFVFIAYLVIALISFGYLTFNMGHVTTGGGGDGYLNPWDVWWVNYATFVLHTNLWYSSMVFYPVGENLVFHTLAPLAGFMVAPIALVNPIAAFDIVVFLGFALSGLGMFVLADYFVKNKYAAFIAGFLFTFSATHIDHATGLLIFTQIEWIPLGLYFFIRMLREKKAIYAAGLGACIMLATFMGNIEQTIMLGLLLLLVLILYAINKPTRRLVISKAFLRNAVIAVVVCLIVGSWGFMPLISTVLKPGTLSQANNENTAQYNMLWSADLASFFVPSYINTFFFTSISKYSVYLYDPAEKVAYIGYTVIILSVIGLMNYWKKSNSMKMWLAISIAFAWMSLGPSLQINGFNTGIPTLYNVYHSIPVLNVIREPGRFSIITSLGVAMLAAMGAKFLLEREKGIFHLDKKNSAILMTVLICLIYLFEVDGIVLAGPVLNTAMTAVRIPSLYTKLGNLTSNFSVYTIPVLPSIGGAPDLYPGMTTFYQSVSKKAVVGGLDGRYSNAQLISMYNVPLTTISQQLQDGQPPVYSSPVSENYSEQTVMSMYLYHTYVLIVDTPAFDNASLNYLYSYLGNAFGSPIYTDNTTVAYSTQAAFAGLFRNYVSFPDPAQWQAVNASVNGTSRIVWIPISPGLITVYAPYGTSPSGYVNTTVSFNAISTQPQTLELGLVYNGALTPIRNFRIGTSMSAYNANVTLPSGTNASSVAFITSNSSIGEIGIENIIFSKAGVK